MLVCQRKRHHNIWYILLNPRNANIVGILATAVFFLGAILQAGKEKKQRALTQKTYKQHPDKHQYRSNGAILDILFL